MQRRPPAYGEGKAMKVIRAHDYAPRPVPDLKALRRIMVAFVVAAALCLAMCVALAIHGKVPQAARKQAPCECGCR
jgi:hypothetical protein